jgi:hypothetical protein
MNQNNNEEETQSNVNNKNDNNNNTIVNIKRFRLPFCSSSVMLVLTL